MAGVKIEFKPNYKKTKQEDLSAAIYCIKVEA